MSEELIQGRKYFTIDEAEKLLPEVTKLLTQVQITKLKIEALSRARELLQISIGASAPEGNDFLVHQDIKSHKEFHKLHYEFFTIIDDLTEKGCILKDIDEGLIDFNFKFEGRNVLLCWKQGEQKIEHWHELDIGYEGRQKIVDLDLAK